MSHLQIIFAIKAILKARQISPTKFRNIHVFSPVINDA